MENRVSAEPLWRSLARGIGSGVVGISLLPGLPVACKTRSNAGYRRRSAFNSSATLLQMCTYRRVCSDPHVCNRNVLLDLLLYLGPQPACCSAVLLQSLQKIGPQSYVRSVNSGINYASASHSISLRTYARPSRRFDIPHDLPSLPCSEGTEPTKTTTRPSAGP